GKYKGTPALVVEVLSNSTRSRDLVQKLDLYMESGIHEYWVVNTQSQEIYIYTFTDNKLANILTFKGEEHAQSVFFPGLEVGLQLIFA
ncbi:MAG TPA: prevent-host-death protein, partial [Firmicutes bacterium]|nr:prevent-host-death protein [Bacillota bacterium]